MADIDPVTPPLDSSGCCEEAPAAPELSNRPGLPELRYRLGTHSSFLQRMLQQLPRQIVPAKDADRLLDSGDAKVDAASRDALKLFPIRPWTRGALNDALLELGHAPEDAAAALDRVGAQPLGSLTTRAGDDPAIALADAWATVGDVLTFYSERIANEGFLRTATERRSVLELARAIGYELRPGVAASTYLAFTVDEPVGPPGPVPLPTRVTVPAGTPVQSVPQQGELPQTFETSTAIEARLAWNALRPAAWQPQTLAISDGEAVLVDAAGTSRALEQIYVAGSSANLKRGDVLMLHDLSTDDVAAVVAKAVTVETAPVPGKPNVTPLSWTRVDLAGGAPDIPSFNPPDPAPGQVLTTALPFTAENVKAKVFDALWDERDLRAFLGIQRWDEDDLLKQVEALRAAAEAPAMELYVFRQRVGFFGHNAPLHASLVYPAGTTNPWADWDAGRTIWQNTKGDAYGTDGQDTPDVYLERVVPEAAAGSWVLFNPGTLASAQVFRVKAAVESSLVEFAITGKSTGLALDTPSGDEVTSSGKSSSFDFRKTSALAQSEALPLYALPVVEPVGDPAKGQGAASLRLDRMVLGLAPGQAVVVRGAVLDAKGAATGVSASEVVWLDRVTHARGRTSLFFATALSRCYARAGLELSANVAPATHGESVRNEVLGHGDAQVPNQELTLKKAPVTFVSAPTPGGAKSTVTVRVNGVAWKEVPSLYGLSPSDDAYILRTDDDATTRVVFGDGKQGARLPTGNVNVTATYRTGIGPAGELKAGRLSLLTAKPQGLKDVSQPVPATGSGAPETLAQARENAPRTVLTLDRVVSLQDYEDFARSFAGVAKAKAAVVWAGERRRIHLTVAGPNGNAVPEGGATQKNLADALRRSGDPTQAVTVAGFAPRYFRLTARLVVDPAYEPAAVKAAAAAALASEFAFDARGFGQPVTESEVLAVLQGVPGVVAAVTVELYDAAGSPSLDRVLPASLARWDASGGAMLPAELLLLHPSGPALTTEVSS